MKTIKSKPIYYLVKCDDEEQRKEIRKAIRKGAIINDLSVPRYLLSVLRKLE
jgi:hypothetical protein